MGCFQHIKLAFFILFLSIFSGCAVNRVKYVQASEDAQSFYKTPIIFGECKEEKHENNVRSRYLYSFLQFGEFNSRTKKELVAVLAQVIILLYH